MQLVILLLFLPLPFFLLLLFISFLPVRPFSFFSGKGGKEDPFGLAAKYTPEWSNERVQLTKTVTKLLINFLS